MFGLFGKGKKKKKKSSNEQIKNSSEATINKSLKSKRRRKIYGFAQTKEEPHKNHPAFYKKKNQDEIDYVTFTHSSEIKDKKGNIVEKTIPLTGNIDPEEKNRKSYIYPKSYEGKRSSLGEERPDLSLNTKDKKIVLDSLETLPKEKVKKTSNSKNKKKKC